MNTEPGFFQKTRFPTYSKCQEQRPGFSENLVFKLNIMRVSIQEACLSAFQFTVRHISGNENVI